MTPKNIETQHNGRIGMALVMAIIAIVVAIAVTGCNGSNNPTAPTGLTITGSSLVIGAGQVPPVVVNRPGITSPTDAPVISIDEKGEAGRWALELRWGLQSLASNVHIIVHRWDVTNTWVEVDNYEETANLGLSLIQAGEGGLFKIAIAYEFPDGVVSNYAEVIKGVGNQSAPAPPVKPCKGIGYKGTNKYKPNPCS